MLYFRIEKIVTIWSVLMCVCLFMGCGQLDKATSIPLGIQKELSLEEEPVQNNIIGIPQEEPSGENQTQSPAVIYVYVCGEVNHPGVVMLPEGSRANDALIEAGGFTENAGENIVNLAEKLTDGEKLYIPSKEEVQGMIEESLAGDSIQLVDINHAGEDQLTSLPGIGESRAKDIISYREKNGAFSKTEDIMSVTGIKESTYEKIKDLITVK